MVNGPIPKYYKRRVIRSFDAADYIPDMSDMDVTNPYAFEEVSANLAQKRVLDKDARVVAIFGLRHATDFTPFPEYTLCDAVISEEELARYRQVVVLESDMERLKIKLDATMDAAADKATLNLFQKQGAFMGIDSMTSDVAALAEKK